MPDKSHIKYPRPARAVQVAPNVRVLPANMNTVPRVAVLEWRERPVTFEDGRKGTAFVPIMRIKRAWMRITEAAKLPIGLSEEIILTLGRAGFIELGRATPHSSNVNVVSLLDHIEATAVDPDYWTRERVQRYKDWLTKKKKPKAQGLSHSLPVSASHSLPPQEAMT